MRKSAASWATKLLLGLICLSFALFFGYSAAQNQQLSQNEAARVGDSIITLAQYNRTFDASLKQMGENFGGEVPENFKIFLRNQALEQLIARETQTLFAEQIGFTVADYEMARIIRKQKSFYRDGIFDKDYYQNQFRPFYQRRFGVDYEEALRKDLLLDLFASFTDKALLKTSTPPPWQKAMEQQRWIFEVTTIPSTALTEKDKTTLAQLQPWFDKWQKGALTKRELKKLNGTREKKPAVSLKDRRTLTGQQLSDDVYQKIFQLTLEQPRFTEPLQTASGWHFIQLIKKTTDQKEAVEAKPSPLANPRSGNAFISAWLHDFTKELNIKKAITF